MGGGGDHHHEPFEVPKWQKFNNWQQCTELLEHQRRLNVLGLKDPWVRNFTWIYTKQGLNRYGHSPWAVIKQTVFSGWKAGVAATIALIAIDEGYLYFKYGYTSWNAPHH